MNSDSTSRHDPRGPLPTDKVYQARKPLPVLLSRYVVAANGCWEWTGTRNKQGYGVVCVAIDKRPTGIPAPRLQWMHCHGGIPDGMVVMHACDNPPCINPAHLMLGSQAANLADMRAKGRQDTESGLNALLDFHEKVRRGEAVYTPFTGARKKKATP